MGSEGPQRMTLFHRLVLLLECYCWWRTFPLVSSWTIPRLNRDLNHLHTKVFGHQDDHSTSLLSSSSSPSPPVAADIGLYIHIPFCRKRCRYCNFAIVPVGPGVNSNNDGGGDDGISTTTSTGFAAMNRNYTAALIKELAHIQAPPRNGMHQKKKIALSSIYFGGGTPSLAPMETFHEIFGFLKSADSPLILPSTTSGGSSNSSISRDKDIEITIEMDPGTFSREKLQALKDLGFNRISLGIQSFNNEILERLGRVHRLADIQASLEMILDIYGQDVNYSIDLISGLPGLSLAAWIETLQTATNLHPQPSHMSLYDLTIESGTVFGNWYDDKNKGKEQGSSTFRSTKGDAPTNSILPPLPSDEESAFQYSFAAGYLRSKGYDHYEVSSYAKSRAHYSWHNQIYWGYDTQWYAAGLGATSFVQGQLVARPRALFDYLAWVDKTTSSTEEVVVVQDDADADDLDVLMDIVLKRLRTKSGLNLDWVQRRFGHDYSAAVLKGAELGLELDLAVYDDHGVLRLIDSKGFLFSNSIISSIFVEMEAVMATRSKTCAKN